RPAYAGTVENSVYLLESHQRLGIGRRLLEELVALAAAHGFHTVIARISGGNEASIALHAACGYETVGVEREVGRKFGRWLDVVERRGRPGPRAPRRATSRCRRRCRSPWSRSRSRGCAFGGRCRWRRRRCRRRRADRHAGARTAPSVASTAPTTAARSARS